MRISAMRIHYWVAAAAVSLALAVAAYGPNGATADIPPGAITPTPSGPAAPTPDLCQTPVDISLVFDHSGSMSQNSKLPNAQQAATGFVDQMAGGDNDLSPHQMALTGFAAGVASTDVALTTNAGALKAAINGYTADAFTNIGRALQLGQLELVGGTDPDVLVLLSDGSANRPMDADAGGAENEFYIDVNDNGYIDTGDGLNYDYPPPEADTFPDFRVLNGLWTITSVADLNEALDVNGDGFVDQFDDFNFGPGFNFSIIDGAFYLDANGDGNFASNGLEPPDMTPGHDDEVAVLRTGRVWGNNQDFSGDGSDVYAQYWARQAKAAGTIVYAIGYDLGASQDGDLLQAMASSPSHYFAGGPSDIGQVFQQIAADICGATPTPSPTPSPMPTASPTPSPTPTGSPTPSPMPTASPTPSPTPTASPTPTPTPTASPTPSPTPTASPTPSPTPTASPTPSPTPTASPTPSPTTTASPTPSPTDTPTSTPTDTPTPTPTDTPTPSASPTSSPASSPTATPSPSATPTASPTPSPTVIGFTATPTPAATGSATPAPSPTPSPTPTPTPTGVPTPTSSATPSSTPKPSSTTTATPTPSPTVTPTLTPTATPTASPSPSPAPTQTPGATLPGQPASPSPAALPIVLPPTGGLSAPGNSSIVVLLAALGAFLGLAGASLLAAVRRRK